LSSRLLSKNVKIRIYKTVILPVVHYECETWYLIIREEHRLRVLRGVMGGWRKLHNEDLYNLYSSQSIIRMIKSRKMRWAGHVTRMGEKINAYRILVGKPEGKRPLGRPRRRWAGNITMDIRDIGWDGIDLIDLAQDMDKWRALVNTLMNLWVP
jgi:hypothetical protein